MPAVGPYSRPAMVMSIVVGRGKEPMISSSTSGAPWPNRRKELGCLYFKAFEDRVSYLA